MAIKRKYELNDFLSSSLILVLYTSIPYISYSWNKGHGFLPPLKVLRKEANEAWKDGGSQKQRPRCLKRRKGI